MMVTVYSRPVCSNEGEYSLSVLSVYPDENSDCAYLLRFLLYNMSKKDTRII